VVFLLIRPAGLFGEAGYRKDLIHDVNKFRRGRRLRTSARVLPAAQQSLDRARDAVLAAFAGVPLIANDYC